MVEKLRIKFHAHNKFEDAFPMVSMTDNDEESLPPLVREFLREDITESFITKGDYRTCSRGLISLLSSLRAISRRAEGEGAVDVLAVLIINMMELISAETYLR